PQGGEWLIVTPEGFFDASAPAVASRVLTVGSGLDTFSIDPFLAALHRPDLVREKLRGDPDGKVQEAAAAVHFKSTLDSRHAPGLRPVKRAQATPSAALPVNVVQQMGHSSALEALAYSADGRFVASGSADNSAKIWEVATSREVRTFTGHSKRVEAVTFSP